MSQGTETLKRTPLHDRHVAAGARLVPYAGWEMPVQYAGIREEHKAVRNQVGIFDVSHMGEIETEGPDAEAFLQHILSNDVTKIAQDGAQYSVLCNEAGGVLDDLFTYRLGHDRFLTVTNAANHEKDLAWFQRHAADFDVRIHDRISDYAMLAIQGPEARALVQQLSDGELPKRFRTATLHVAGVDALVAGTGYTGEDGVEILTAPGNAPSIWNAATREGAQPAGLGARDTLRLEVCFHLYGNDLSEDRGPIEAGLGWCCKEDTNFVGSDIVRAARENGTPEKLVPFALTGPGIARQGNAINGGGVVTSGTLSPCLDIGIGMAYLPAEKAVPGTPFEIDVRGKTRPAEVRTKPLYSKES
jgi:glycine cleavage system T protein (aminomethyltransferase)